VYFPGLVLFLLFKAKEKGELVNFLTAAAGFGSELAISAAFVWGFKSKKYVLNSHSSCSSPRCSKMLHPLGSKLLFEAAVSNESSSTILRLFLMILRSASNTISDGFRRILG
jgi:hypothetical protein